MKNALQWLFYIFNSVINTKLPTILSRWHSTTVSLETYPLYSIQTPSQQVTRSELLVTSGKTKAALVPIPVTIWSPSSSFWVCYGKAQVIFIVQL